MENGSKKTILIVDDDIQEIELLSIELSEENWRLVITHSGVEALNKIMLEKPDLVILDVLMPVMDGYETLKKIKEQHPNIPVVMVSAVWDNEESQRCLKAGCCEYITKPVDFEKLKSVILNNLLVNE